MKERSPMKKFQRIGAVAVIVILLSLYVVCFISALSGGEKAQVIFKATLGMTIALPILLYIFILFLKAAKKRQESLFAPPEELPEEPEEGGGSDADAP